MPDSKKETKKDLLEKISKLTAALQLERADAENSRKRFRMERLRLIDFTQAEAVTNLLPLLDNLERAFVAVPDNLRTDNWVKGVLYIEQQLQHYLKDLNLQPIATVGRQFDPLHMEAVATVVDKSQKSGTVLTEVLKGYTYKDQVLRPAQVKVVQNDSM